MATTLCSDYSRLEPIRRINPHQSMYDLVFSMNRDNMEFTYANFLGKKKSFQELKVETDKLASALHFSGVKPGDVVGVAILTIPETAPLLLAIDRIGATSFWIDVRTSPEDFLHYVLDLNIHTLFIIEPLLPLSSLLFAQSNIQNIVVLSLLQSIDQSVIIPAELDQCHILSYTDFIRIGSFVLPIVAYERNRVSVIVQSSGSTGKVKAICHSDFNFNLQVWKMSYVDMPFYVGRKSMIIAPPWIVYGLVTSAYSSLVFGMEGIYTLEPTDDLLYKNIDTLDVVFGVPIYYRYLYEKLISLKLSGSAGDLTEYTHIRECLSHSSVFISGGDKMTIEEQDIWQEEFAVPLCNGYGNNEVVGAAIVMPMSHNQPGSIGLPMKGTVICTADPETSELLPAGAVGELIIYSEALFIKYINDDEETNRIKRYHNGRWWVHTGDLGYLDDKGFVYISGRSKRLIIDKFGYKISPDNSENVISKLPFVTECVTVGVAIGPNDTVPMSFVSISEPETESDFYLSEIKKQCDDLLKDYERPKFIQIISSIPHKANGGKRDFSALEKIAEEYVLSNNLYNHQQMK